MTDITRANFAVHCEEAASLGTLVQASIKHHEVQLPEKVENAIRASVDAFVDVKNLTATGDVDGEVEESGLGLAFEGVEAIRSVMDAKVSTATYFADVGMRLADYIRKVDEIKGFLDKEPVEEEGRR